MATPADAEALQVAPGRDIWRRAKRLEGLPGEWSAPIWTHRAIALHERLATHHEPLRGLGDLDGVLNIIEAMDAAGLDEAHKPSLMVTADVYSNCYAAAQGVLTIPTSDDRYVGLHALTVLRRTHGGEFAFRNTWGEAWGDEGYGLMTRAYAKRYLGECWVSRIHFLGPTPWQRISSDLRPAQLLAVERGRDDFRLAWTKVNRGGALVIEGRRAVARVMMGLPNSETVVAVRIYPDEGDRPLGWLHMKEISGRRWLVEEWFVEPLQRRQGHGAALLRWAQRDAGRRGGTRLVLRLLAADAERNELLGDVVLPRLVRDLTWSPVRDHAAYVAGATLPCRK